MKTQSAILFFNLSIVLIVALVGIVSAHEGHKPLPTKGIEVQPETGTLILSASAREAIEVTTKEVSKRPLSSALNTYGTTTIPWRNHALVGSTLEGRVVSVLVVAGDQVEAGQVVARIESPAIDRLQREIRDLLGGIRLDRQLLEGTQEASKSGAIPSARILELQTSLFQKETALRIAQAKWLGFGLSAADLERVLTDPQVYQTVRLELKSPIAGTVLHNDLTVGKFVNVKEHVLEVIGLSSLWLRVDILEKDLGTVHEGSRVEFVPTSRTSTVIGGSIRVIEKVLDSRTHVATAWVDLANDVPGHEALLPGMTGQVRIGPNEIAPSLLVPSEAVIRDGAERFVLVEQERSEKASSFRKIPLAIGVQSGGDSQVLRGDLVPGDRVLCQGSRQLGRLFSQGVLKLSPEAIQDIGLKTMTVREGVIAKTLSVDGIVSLPPSKLARVSPQISGRIQQIMIEPGASVRAGQTVAVLSSTEFQDLQLDCLQANLELKFRESVLANIRQAGSNVPQRQRLESESLVVSARNRLENAVRQLQLLGIAQKSIESMLQSQQILEYFPVQSPIDGIVVGFNKAIGHIVSADEELLEVHDTSERLVEAFVSEIDAGSIRQGQTLRCRTVAEEHRSYPGKVLSSSQSLSNRGQTLSIWAKVEFDQDSMIYHNMLCRLAIQIPESDSNGDSNANAQVVPLSSILKEGSQSFVFVALTDGSYQRQRVTLGRSDGTEVAILSGLQSGDVVVVQGVSALQTGYAAIQ